MANWNLDTAHSEIEFRVKHMMISTLKGQFENFDVQFENEGSDFQTATISADIDTASISTKNQQRDQHLKSEDFFSADKFPKIKFVSTQINKTAENKYDLIGDLTIKDITNPVTLQVEYGGIGKDPWGNQKAGYNVAGKINRNDFGLTWNAALETGGVMVSEDVKFQADMQFTVS